jgi:hypothetical protein
MPNQPLLQTGRSAAPLESLSFGEEEDRVKWLNIALRFAPALAAIGLAIFLWTQPTPPARPTGPLHYKAFAVEIDGEWIKIRNTGAEILTNCSIEFTADLDSPGGATYQGKRYYAKWEPGEAQEIGISTSRGPTDVLSVRFTGTASSPDKAWDCWRLTCPAVAGDE